MAEHKKELESQIRQAMERLTPDEAAKDRMYLEIMRRAAASPKKSARPWYMRRRTSAGICAAALACVAIVTASIYTKMPQNTHQLEVVMPEETETTSYEEIGTTILTETMSSESGTETNDIKTTGTQNYTVTNSADTDENLQIDAAQSDNAVTETYETETVAVVQQTKTAETTRSEWTSSTTAAKNQVSETTNAPEQTDAAVQTTVSSVTTQATDETGTTEQNIAVTAEGSSLVDVEPTIQQNIYLYYLLSWNGVQYRTRYTKTTAKQIEEYLGSGVTSGTDVTDTYTVLIYTIIGEDPEEKLAVQYAGEDVYYIFTAE